MTARHQLGAKFKLELEGQQDFNYVDSLQNSKTWSTMDWLDYQFADKLFIGGGLGAGYANVDGPASDMVFEQVKARMSWRLSDKLFFSLNGGLDIREPLSGDQSDEVNPVFGASLQYAPFKYTQVVLSANRSISTSDLYVAQSTENTVVSLSVNQRLFEKFNLQLTAGYNRTDYNETIFGFNLQNRTDDIYSFSARISRSFLKRGNVSVLYQYNDDRSNQGGYSYRSNQVGFSVGFSY